MLEHRMRCLALCRRELRSSGRRYGSKSRKGGGGKKHMSHDRSPKSCVTLGERGPPSSGDRQDLGASGGAPMPAGAATALGFSHSRPFARSIVMR